MVWKNVIQKLRYYFYRTRTGTNNGHECFLQVRIGESRNGCSKDKPRLIRYPAELTAETAEWIEEAAGD